MNHSAHLTGTPVTYYDVLEPAGGPTRPTLVLVHGGAHTGACYLRTVDGRPGWAHDFVELGHRVVVPDWAGRGRSGFVPEADISGELVCQGLAQVIRVQAEPVVLITHSMGGQLGWKLLEMMPEHISMIVGVAPGPPGNMQSEPTIVLETPEEIQVRTFPNAPILSIRTDAPYLPSLPWATEKLIGGSARFPRELIGDYVASLSSVPSLMQKQRSNFRGMSMKMSEGAFQNRRILIVVGTDDTEHPIAYERGMRDWLGERGAQAEICVLGDYGISGNGHMLMLESNSSVIAGFIASKIAEDGVGIR